MSTDYTSNFTPQVPNHRAPRPGDYKPLIAAIVVAGAVLAVLIGVALGKSGNTSSSAGPDAQAAGEYTSESQYPEPPASFINTVEGTLGPKGYHPDTDMMVEYALSACSDIRDYEAKGNGEPVWQVVLHATVGLNKNNPGEYIDLDDTKILVRAAITYYCPEYIGSP